MRFLGYLTVAGLTTGVLLAGAGAVSAARGRTAAAPGDQAPSLVEDYSYPGADQIHTQRDIVLKKGDGHLLLTDCAVGADLIQVRSRSRDPFCFKATGPGGWLTMELTDAFLVFSDSQHTTVADYTVNGVADSKTIDPGAAAGIGEGESNGQSAVLVKLTAK